MSIVHSGAPFTGLTPVQFSLHYCFLFWQLSIRYSSCIFHSCIFHPCDLLLIFPLLHFPPLRSAPDFSTPAFSTPAVCSRIFHSRIFHSRIFSAPGRVTVTTKIVNKGAITFFRMNLSGYVRHVTIYSWMLFSSRARVRIRISVLSGWLVVMHRYTTFRCHFHSPNFTCIVVSAWASE